MKHRLKAILLALSVLCAVMLLTSCQKETTPYDEYDEEGYSVSVKYDANGGAFATNTTVIVDTANLSSLKTNGEGKAELPLISPSDPVRGSGNAFTANKSGYFLAGWYTERTAKTNASGQVLDVNGGIAEETGKDVWYEYAGYWDFENDVYLLDTNKEYSADEPVVTLYAAWVPEFAFDFYTADGTTLLKSLVIDPTKVTSVKLPSWDSATGKLSYNDFPSVAGKTFVGLSTEIGGAAHEGATLEHSGSFDIETAEHSNHRMNVYVDYTDGEWFRITTAQQMVSNASPSGCYYIEADLDFTGISWPSAFGGIFSGKILGNGHTLSNISATQNSKRDSNGLFGRIDAAAVIQNVQIVNATYTLKSTAKAATGTTYGLLAGRIAEGATFSGVVITNAKFLISEKCMFPDHYQFGLIAGSVGGEIDVTNNGISVESLNDSAYEDLTVIVDPQTGTVTVVKTDA